ncbi:hypothetical protein [Bradyrhizobium zhanjiangense]|uniref:hypothetical protein n=1 Tax=Bradyrhizobium zhanjiangense TaxID=1325107 RepID=UPI0013E8F14D|nr:hypothetical protein [Bradyrhizobium zhanjiangense]
MAAVDFMAAACALGRSTAARALRMCEAAHTAPQAAGMASLGVVTDTDQYKADLWRAQRSPEGPTAMRPTAEHIGVRRMV